MNYHHLYKCISDLHEDDDIYRLLKEIDTVVQFPLTPYTERRSQVIHYLTDYRARRPIHKTGMDKTPLSKFFLLNQKISKLDGGPVFELCCELAYMKRDTIENHGSSKLYVFLDRLLKNEKKKKKKLLPGYMY